MKILFKAIFAVLAASVAMYGTSAKAQILEYTSEASFNAAITQIGATITFEGADTNGGYTTYDGTNDFGSAVNFTDGDGNYAVTTGFGANYDDLSTSLVGDGRTSQILAPIATTGITALGTQIFSGASTALSDKVEVFLVGNTSSTPDATYTLSANAVDDSTPTSFIGFTTATGSIGSVVFEATTYPDGSTDLSPLPIDNVEIGSLNPVTVVPEPATYGCLLLGGALLFLVNRRKSPNA